MSQDLKEFYVLKGMIGDLEPEAKAKIDSIIQEVKAILDREPIYGLLAIGIIVGDIAIETAKK